MIEKGTIPNLVLNGLTMIESIQKVEVKHLLGEGGINNMDIHSFLEVLRKVYLYTNPMLGRSIENIICLKGYHLVTSLHNGLQERLTQYWEPRKLNPNWNFELLVI